MITGKDKPFMTELSAADYAEVRRFGAEYRGRKPRSLGARVKDLVFERDTLVAPTLGPTYSRHLLETTLGPLAKLVSALQGDPPRLAQLRAELEGLCGEIIHGNEQRQHFLMSRATKV